MEQLYVFLIKNDVWIYFLCGLGALWYGYEFIRGAGSLQRAQFSLERERATRRRNGSFLFLLFFVVVAAFVTFVDVRIQPTLPDELLNPPTPTPRPFVTPFVENAAPTPTRRALPTPTSILAPTATLRTPLTPTPTEASTNSNVVILDVEPLREGCDTGVDIVQPRSGSTISGGVSVFGSADSTSFRSYVLEINGPETGGEWTPITPVAITQAVPNGFLGSANLEDWETGVYQIRLSVIAGNNVQTGQCTIQIGLNNDS
ncbi:MAG: hypothetical protein M9918_10735 [Anaerolineae bacterium]|nr:hypothetical protein [Anaerolineae bacterium]MCO5188656.1 hypothetical protein [Anaerolineae bacterium]MCO5192824.1 hypothetical protein [Anaerolineae bacterium]